MQDLEWVDLGDGELILKLDGRESGIVSEVLGTDWEWDSEEYGVLTDEEDGTVTEWVTLHGARRRSLTALPSAEMQAA